ncbi:double-stranded RNA-binding protein Staufen homolog 2 [Cydia fagiglandana]|uniref:double-stranded RNA-binding protein Staufen homolog 2 n=1 Tax=Cydia fagiglandana TaxID=1458189 RepID=UPI002FEDFF31
MMHHPNMHHQPMSGHPPQHMGGHQGMPGHHQMQPHQLHRENRHVTLTRVPLGPSGGGMGGHGQLGMGAMVPPHHAPAQRPPHPIRAMPHHPQQHHSMPPQPMKQMRRGYGVGYGPAGVVPAYAHPPLQPPAPLPVPAATPAVTASPAPTAEAAEEGAKLAEEARAAGDEARPPPAAANSKEKTPMCLVNELARYNKIKHQYRLTSETGPAHKKVFTVTLRLGDTEEYTAEGSSIKRAQHSAASAALSATHFPPPPPRAPPAHAPMPHHRHSGAVMPTVELNALAMKLCQPAIYTSIPAVAAPVRARSRPPAYRVPPFVPNVYQRMLSPGLVYRVRVTVGDRAWLGEGSTPQGARHDAAARALHDLRPPPDAPNPPAQAPAQTNGDAASDIMNSEVKSPVSLVHELALKRNLTVQFTVKSERGPPHMRVFITVCTVGEMETEGEGNGKKVSKRRAAERMLEEMRRRWPPQLLRARAQERRRPPPAKKKPRNLIKEGSGLAAEAGGGAGGGADNPISLLAQARHAARARSPQYRVLEERGAARRREFLVQCDAPPHQATGLGPNKKTAKRRAAHNVLLAMEMNGGAEGVTNATLTDTNTNGAADASCTNGDAKRKESPGAGGAGDARQPVPGVLLMDYRTPQPTNGVSETGATGGSNSSPGAKEQLMYLSQLLGFTVQFSDFPKRNHGEYLSLVSLSTEPPVMCHGGGPSTQHSHEQCARAALRALALMGLDAPPQPQTNSLPGSKPALSNGVAE